jgi:hypothetical protein
VTCAAPTPAHAPRPDKARRDWLESLRNGDSVTVVGLGQHRLASVIMRMDSGDLLVSGGIVFDGMDGECARRELWIMAVDND